MIVFLNGKFIPEDQALVSVFDRGFMYGDGIFEAILVVNEKAFRWTQHMERFERSAAALKLPIPFSRDELTAATQELLVRNQARDCVLRIILSRGIGPRGYAMAGTERPTVVISIHPAPATEPAHPLQWKLIVSSFRVAANDPLANHKTNSRLLQVMARSEIETRNADEALLVNTEGEITEGSGSNVFWVRERTICTPPIQVGALPGITRAVVGELCQRLSVPFMEQSISPAQLRETEGVFLTVTTRGVVEAISIDGVALARSAVVSQLRIAYEELVARESVPTAT